MKGLAGYLLVADGTRPATIDTAIHLKERTEELFGPLPFVFLLNKYDLESQWAVSEDKESELRDQGWEIYKTSAKTGDHVEASFSWLASRIF